MNYLYYNIDLRITINDSLVFERCQSIHIESSVDVLSDFAKIELPRFYKNAVDKGGKSVSIGNKSILDFIKRGDTVKIEFGYDGDLKTEFSGYLSKIGAETPLLLECEDEMYQLKKAPKVTKSIKSGNLIDILKAVVPTKYKIECNGDYNIGKWLIQDATPYEVLEELRDKAGIRAFFKTPTTLSVGMIVDFKSEKIHDYNFSQNVRRGSSLTFKETIKPYHLTIESKQSNGTIIKVTTGQKGGNETTIKLWSGLSEKELNKWLDARYKVAVLDGFEGSLDGWCYPRTKTGDTARIYRPLFRDNHQNGGYFISGVTIDVNGNNGIKRTNTIGHRLF